MKRKIAMLMAVCMMTGSILVGCEAPEAEETGTTSTGTTTGEAFEGDASEYRIGLMIPGNLGDKSFFDASYEAAKLLEETYGMKVDSIEVGTDSSKYYPTYLDMCEAGYDLILTVSSNGDDAFVQIAEEYPDQKFINLDGELDDIPANAYIVAPKNNELSFLAGAAAALKAEELGEDTIGFVGGMDIPGINEFLVGYIEGAQQINPDIKVSSSYVGSFTDNAKGKENALLLYDSGISVIFVAAGSSGLGVIDAAVERGKYVIGVDSDQAAALEDSQPEMAKVIITSAIKNIPDIALNVVEKAMAGELTYGVKEYYGLAENAVGIVDNVYYQELLSEEARATVEDLRESVVNGTLEVSDTSGMSTEELIEIRDSVRP